jgi:endonuclease/exonuclease/phosphatase family metal-dependent hydrolase
VRRAAVKTPGSPPFRASHPRTDQDNRRVIRTVLVGLNSRLVKGAFLLVTAAVQVGRAAPIPVVTQTNVTVRVMAANLTSGNNQLYEAPGVRIFQGLKPDIVAIQEFNYGSKPSSPAQIRSFVDLAFGTNFQYFRETNALENYTIPNGVISRYPIVAADSWDDTTSITDRGFAWARIQLPGTNLLQVVSVHLKASSSSSAQRAIQATNLTRLIQANIPSNAWLIVAGDFNIGSPGEAALAEFKTYLCDSPVPTDAVSGGDADTNEGRTERYDYVLASFSFTNQLTGVTLASHTFPNGLVFDSAVYAPITDVAPVMTNDSHVTGMQHMGVVKDFEITFSVTNFISVDAPVLSFEPPGILRWQGLSHLAYTVWSATNLTGWSSLATVTSSTSGFSFTNPMVAGQSRFYRVTYP